MRKVMALSVAVLLAGSMLGCGGEEAKKAKSMSNLKSLGLAMRIYQSANNEQMPAELKAVVGGNFTADMLTPPKGGKYVYVTGLSSTDPAATKTIVVYEDPANYDSKGTVALFLDGHVEWVTMDVLNAQIKK